MSKCRAPYKYTMWSPGSGSYLSVQHVPGTLRITEEITLCSHPKWCSEQGSSPTGWLCEEPSALTSLPPACHLVLAVLKTPGAWFQQAESWWGAPQLMLPLEKHVLIQRSPQHHHLRCDFKMCRWWCTYRCGFPVFPKASKMMSPFQPFAS